MGNVTKAASYLSEEEIFKKIKETVGFWRVQKWLVIWNAMVDPRPASQIALHTGLAIQTVHNLISNYNRIGPAAIETPGKGGEAKSLPFLGRRDFFFGAIHSKSYYRSDRHSGRDQGGSGR